MNTDMVSSLFTPRWFGDFVNNNEMYGKEEPPIELGQMVA